MRRPGRGRRRCRSRWQRCISAAIRSRLTWRSDGDLDYDYDRVSLTGQFQHERGNYTRMGDVTALVKGIDDRYAIFGSGEEIAAEFDSSKLPALPEHWKRDYFFYANGYVKDMDWWDASPFTVAQLPFHKMSTYPYPASEKFPDDDGALEYQLNWNDRWDSGEPVRSYRFDYHVMTQRPGPPAARADGRLRRTGGAAMRDLVLEPAVRQLELLRTGEISVAELAEAHIRQIERLNPELNAFADFDAERVRARAQKHDVWRGQRARRPLFGLPVTVKSSIATAGIEV